MPAADSSAIVSRSAAAVTHCIVQAAKLMWMRTQTAVKRMQCIQALDVQLQAMRTELCVCLYTLKDGGALQST